MRKEITLEAKDYDSMREIIKGIANVHYDNFKIKVCWDSLPDDIRDTGIEHGCDDAMFRNEFDSWVDNNIDKKEVVILDVNKINGNEIIAFLNEKSTYKKDGDNDSNLQDISIESASYKFGSQEVEEGNYDLTFTCSFNNWGTSQSFNRNSIMISPDGTIVARLDEPFEGDESADVLEEEIFEWIKTHEFSDCFEDEFNVLMREVYETLPELSVASIEEMQEVIDKLVKAKTYMK